MLYSICFFFLFLYALDFTCIDIHLGGIISIFETPECYVGDLDEKMLYYLGLCQKTWREENWNGIDHTKMRFHLWLELFIFLFFSFMAEGSHLSLT